MSSAVRRIAAVCGVGALVLLLFEAMLRVFWPELFPHHIPGIYAPHPELGHVLTRGRETKIVKPEYRVTSRTNSKGFRGAELPPKTGDTIRILCLGDWLTWGEGVEDEQTYPFLVGAALRRHYPAKDIQVVNAGMPQYGTLDELRYLESIVDALQPEFVFAQFYAGDDFEQNEVPSRERHLFRDDMLFQTGSFSATTGPLWLTILKRLKHESHLIHWVSERAGRLAMRAGLLAKLESASSSYFSDEQAALAQELLAEIHAVAARVGARTLFVFAPEKMQVLSRPDPPLRAAGVVSEVAEATAAGFVDLTGPLVAHEEVERLYPSTVGTWRPETYRLAADAIAREIIALGWIDE